MDRKHMKIVVVYGGISSERQISLRSGAAIYDALKRGGYTQVSLFDLKRDNLGDLLAGKPDLAFLALHGKGGEDGSIQGMLTLAGIPYTGSHTEASAVCMNKIRTKEILLCHGIPTPSFSVLYRGETEDMERCCQRLLEEVGLPMVLKAPREGSSIGVCMVKEACRLPDAIREVLTYDDVILAEEFMSGMELTLPMMGNREPVAYPLVEITSENEFYDYTAKYTKGMCHHIIPARISDELRERIVEIGKRAYRALGCRGISRLDFMLDKNGEPKVIEVNTLPGMTEMSLFPDSARSVGVSFEELVDRIVSLALE